MRCEEVQTQLPALLDGELTSETTAIIEAHLAGCADCSAARDEIRAVLAMTQAWSVEGGEILAEVQQQIHQDAMHALLREMKQLRSEVEGLRAEVAELKSQAARRAATPGRESAGLRFPYATVRDMTRPTIL
jgi:predicted anti-sigma-YlaC factor YlaD